MRTRLRIAVSNTKVAPIINSARKSSNKVTRRYNPRQRSHSKYLKEPNAKKSPGERRKRILLARVFTVCGISASLEGFVDRKYRAHGYGFKFGHRKNFRALGRGRVARVRIASVGANGVSRPVAGLAG